MFFDFRNHNDLASGAASISLGFVMIISAKLTQACAAMRCHENGYVWLRAGWHNG
jgi:hypothetical protein